MARTTSRHVTSFASIVFRAITSAFGTLNALNSKREWRCSGSSA